MSIEVDPRIEEAKKLHESRVRDAEKITLKYPDEPLTLEGYTIKSYSSSTPKTRKLPQFHNKNTENDETSVSHVKKRFSKKQEEPDRAPAPTIDFSGMTDNERKVAEYLTTHKKATIDEMTSMGLSVQDITFAITMLEIQGTIKTLPGGYCTLNEN